MRATGSWSVPPDRVELRFTDKKPAYSKAEAFAEASRCLYCYDAPCTRACPTSIDIASFIHKIATGNYRGSARTILLSNLLGASCARVCPVEVLCEGACVYTEWGRKPIEIGRLQRFAMEQGRSADLLPRQAAKDESIGLVGGGPASLACAGTLALLGYETVIYEKSELPGGLNLSGVAPYKIRAEEVLQEVEFIQSLGVKIQTDAELGRDFSGEELLAKHAAVFFAPGLGADSLRGVPGADGSSVVGAVDWIEDMKLRSEAALKGVSSAVVVGGGNTALDVVQELASLGIPEVTLVYRRSEEKMPGYRHEWERAKEKRVRLLAEVAVSEIHRDSAGKMHSISLVRTENGRPTEEAAGELPCELIVVATGQERLASLAALFPQVQCDEKGRVMADPETMATGNPRVFTGGDCYNGGKEVVNAVDDGQRAARAIDRLLRGEN